MNAGIVHSTCVLFFLVLVVPLVFSYDTEHGHEQHNEQAPQGCNTGITNGELMIHMDGKPVLVTVVGHSKENVTVLGNNAVTVKHGAGAYLAQGCYSSFTPDMFLRVQLLGKTVSWIADIHEAGCGCNAAFYMTDMPGYFPNGTANPGKDKVFYCDANDVGGSWCPEMDLQEANIHAFQTTPHQCYNQTGKHWNSCDKGGCGVKATKVDKDSFGPGAEFKIDTQRPYKTSVYFEEKNGVLSGVNITLYQSQNIFKMNSICDSEYLEKFGKQLQNGGMVFIFSYWGTTMNWLDMPPCSNTTKCDGATSVTFSDISIE